MIFRNPKFSNTFTVDTGVKVRRSLDGELLVARGSAWPIIEAFTMEFDSLSDDLKNQFMNFFIGMAGEEFYVQDHEGKMWLGIVRSPDIEFRQSKRLCGWGVRIEFVGKRV